jgi:hypothetical protein
VPILDRALLAHTGHWAINLLYVAPIVVTGLALMIAARIGRRRER